MPMLAPYWLLMVPRPVLLRSSDPRWRVPEPLAARVGSWAAR